MRAGAEMVSLFRIRGSNSDVNFHLADEPMKPRWRISARVPALLLMLALLGLLFLPGGARAETGKGWVLLCSSENGLQGLTRRAAARLFLRRSEMVVTVGKLEPVNLESMQERLAFLSALTRLSPTLVERHFMDLRFRREGDWPDMVAGPNQMLAKLRETPTLIGWLSLEDVARLGDKDLEGLSLLKLDGKLASADGYALIRK